MPKLPKRLAVKTDADVRERARGAADVVSALYDAAFLARRDLAKHAKPLTPPALRGFRKARVGLPSEAEEVVLARRHVTLQVEPGAARRVAARVTVVARGRVDAKELRLEHRGLLWMERDGPRWRVLGFELRQGPVPGKDGKKQLRKAGPGDKDDKGGKERGRDGSGKRSGDRDKRGKDR